MLTEMKKTVRFLNSPHLKKQHFQNIYVYSKLKKIRIMSVVKLLLISL
ncbi:hypothetical protein A225_1094 [Klebsiella michiganensis E718]|nr:hypothetical protein A225_1094 [Klebsiella michiganensis E718]